jgi:hypothetical protein
LFVPGLVDPAGIAELAAGPLPVAVRAATELLTSGTYDSVAGGIAYNTMNDAVTAAAKLAHEARV